MWVRTEEFFSGGGYRFCVLKTDKNQTFMMKVYHGCQGGQYVLLFIMFHVLISIFIFIFFLYIFMAFWFIVITIHDAQTHIHWCFMKTVYSDSQQIHKISNPIFMNFLKFLSKLLYEVEQYDHWFPRTAWILSTVN